MLQTGLDYNLANTQAFSDIRLIWDGSVLLPRVGHTVIVKYFPRQQTGYYGFMWHSPNTGTWDDGDYSWGCHPYPHNDGTVDGNGVRTDNGTNSPGSTGVIHYWENAGLLSAEDWLCSAGESGGYRTNKSVWYTQVRKCRLMTSGPHNGEVEHTYIPDLYGNPNFKIVTYIANDASLYAPTGGDPAFYLGASDWSQYLGGTGTVEGTSGIVRGIQLYSAYLSDTDHEIEATNDSSNTPLTSAGIANVHYMNQNPTPTDVTDKSGEGNDPRWDNANRPILYSLQFNEAGLEFLNNFVGNSSIRMVWSGANLLPRVGHTAIWTIKFSTQTDYYAVAWHTNNDGAWDFGDYSFGTHPWPGNGLFHPTSGNGGEPPGEATGGEGTTVQFYEIAGVTGANDYIRDETGVSLPIVRDVFVTQARSCKTIVGGLDDGKIEHLFWPDISQPTHYLRLLRASAPSTPSDPIFCFGASPWRDNAGGGTGITDEALGGILRGIKLFSTSLSFSDIVTEAANKSNTPVTSDGIANVWYMNQNPTPADITDKSGEGHHPIWDTIYRPNLYSLITGGVGPLVRFGSNGSPYKLMLS